ncbi:MAG TPA: hypothetical protein VH601_20455 [Bryobacteraceae bacterium]|jgi:hypothetical protein
MLPLTLLASQKVANLLIQEGALQKQIDAISAQAGIQIPAINSAQIVISSVAPDLADRDIQLSYPRVCLYSNVVKNAQTEKFRSFSGAVGVVAEAWASGNLVTQTDEWIHYYVEAITTVLRTNVGDWGDGMFFSGRYDVKFQQPKTGGLGFVESAAIMCSVEASLS